MEEVLYEIKQVNGKKFKVFPNRFEIELPGLNKKVMLLIRNITGIEKPSFQNKLIIRTNDGKKYDVVFWKSAEVQNELVKYL